MRILIITQFSALGGSSRIQVIQFFPFFTDAGIAHEHKIVYSDRFYRIQNGIVMTSSLPKKINFFLGMLLGFIKKALYVFSASRYDVVLIQREVFPASWYWLMRKINPRIIYEIEDTIFEINPFWRRGGLYEAALRYQAAMCRNMMRYAAHVIAENEYLAAEARKYNSSISLLTAPIDTERVKPAPKDAGVVDVVIGWIGSPSTFYLLQALAPALAQVQRRHPHAKVKLVGVAADAALNGVNCIAKAWREDEEVGDLQSFDIGLMPLDDMPFNRGRLGYKMIQYMAVGVPIVASDVGLNRTVIEDGKSGFLAGAPEEWVEKLSLLIRDPALRAHLGARGRAIAETRFSVATQSRKFIDIIKQCIQKS